MNNTNAALRVLKTEHQGLVIARSVAQGIADPLGTHEKEDCATCKLITLLEAQKAEGGHCVYELADNQDLPYPRRRFVTSCGLDYCQVELEVWDGTKMVERLPSGNCMKCGRSIVARHLTERSEATRVVSKEKIKDVLKSVESAWGEGSGENTSPSTDLHDDQADAVFALQLPQPVSDGGIDTFVENDLKDIQEWSVVGKMTELGMRDALKFINFLANRSLAHLKEATR